MQTAAQSATWGAPEWTALAALGTFAVALIASGIALVQLRQAKLLYREQVRPFVIVDFAFERETVSISAKNTGATPAMDVVMTFDPPLRGQDLFDPASAPMIAKGIPMMAPGREMRVALGGMHAVFNQGAAYKVTVSYSSLAGEPYADPPLNLDLGAYSQTEIERQPVVDSLRAIEAAIRRAGAGGGPPSWMRSRKPGASASPGATTTAAGDPERKGSE